jgi:hypothetical protein
VTKADVAELVDARDLKSLDGNVVWVRVPPPAPKVGANGIASGITCEAALEKYSLKLRETHFVFQKSVDTL